ncbi:hypothetical protein Tco_1029161, partial [Tanacetum coccineum]
MDVHMSSSQPFTVGLKDVWIRWKDDDGEDALLIISLDSRTNPDSSEEGVSTEDANQKFLRSLPSSWSQVSLVMRTKPGVDSLSFDDLYKNLRVFKSDVKVSTGSSSSAQNVAFVSSERTNSTNDVSTAYGVSTSSGYNSQRENSSSYTVELIRDGPEMASGHDFNETEEVLQGDRKKAVTGHFARECRSKGNQDIKRRDAGNTGYKAKDNRRRPGKQEELKALVTLGWSSDVEDSHVHDRFANVEGMYAVPPPMTGNYIPPGPDRDVDDSMQPKVWSDAPIIEEYESDSDDEYVIQPSKEQKKPSFVFVNTVKHVKTHRETIKEQNTYSPSHKADKRDWNGLMSKRLGLGYGLTKKACFVCSSFSHLIRDYDFHKKRIAKQVELNKKKGKGTGQEENRQVWNNVQRLNHQNKFVPKALLTKTGIFPVNTARQNLSSQAATTSTAKKVNTTRPIVNEIRPRNYFYKSHSPIRRPFNRTTAPKEKISNQKVNTAEVKAVIAVGGKGKLLLSPRQ